jgi:small GTP-binding protein
MKESRRFLESLDLRQIESAVAAEARAQVVIAGPVNSGKSTLFNLLKGQQLSAVSAVPGTTTESLAQRFGPFWLVDTPGFDEIAGDPRVASANRAIDGSEVAILVLDAAAGVRQSDADLYRDLRMRGLPTVVVLNKIDLIKKDLKAAVRDAEMKLGVPIIPISAKVGTNVAEKLIPAIIEAHPRMAVTVGRALPRFRRVAARRVIRESAAVASLTGAEPIPGLGIPILIAVHVRMLLRLAAIYGQTFTAARARELLSAIAGGVLVRYGAQEAIKLIPAAGWIAAGIAAGAGTWGMGQAAMAFFEAEQKLSQTDLHELYRKFRKQGRKGRKAAAETEELR